MTVIGLSQYLLVSNNVTELSDIREKDDGNETFTVTGEK